MLGNWLLLHSSICVCNARVSQDQNDSVAPHKQLADVPVPVDRLGFLLALASLRPAQHKCPPTRREGEKDKGMSIQTVHWKGRGMSSHTVPCRHPPRDAATRTKIRQAISRQRHCYPCAADSCTAAGVDLQETHVSVHISFTPSSTRLQCRSNAFTRPNLQKSSSGP